MKKILVLGAGLVSRPLVRYLLEAGFHVTVASRTLEKARRLIDGEGRGKALRLDAADATGLDGLVSEADLVVSLLPYVFHPDVAARCLAHGRPMVTTSYVSNRMRALDREAREKGLVLLNELGLDPGIDHMSAMKVIHDARRRGGRVVSFRSFCGGLPAPEANSNPYGYKFSWSPRGVIMAGRNPATYRENGELVHIPGPDLFSHHFPLEVEGAGLFEAYPNRDSLPYIDLYGLEGVDTMLRGTLRNVGWAPTMKAMADLGLFDESERDDLHGLTWAGLLRTLCGEARPASSDLRALLVDRLDLGDDPERVLERLDWLGLLSETPLPSGATTLMDALAARMLALMAYQEGERDMIVLHHRFTIQHEDGSEEMTSTLVDFGIPGGDSAMSRTVSLPAAIACRMVLEGEIGLTGVHIPVRAEIYEPILAELERLGIRFVERSTRD